MSWQKTIDYVSQTCVAGHLRILNRVVTNIYDDAFRPLGLKISQANILIIVAQQDVTKPAEICERLQLGPSTLSRNVERMCQPRAGSKSCRATMPALNRSA